MRSFCATLYDTANMVVKASEPTLVQRWRLAMIAAYAARFGVMTALLRTVRLSAGMRVYFCSLRDKT